MNIKLPSFLQREKWALVKTIAINSSLRQNKGTIPYTFYFHLHESSKGNRRVEFGSTNSTVNMQYQHIANQMSIYHEQIKRWENGRYDPEIPKFSETSEEDVVNALKGKI